MATVADLTAVSSSVCPKCGVVKGSGAWSCCARGGSWFENCGDVGDTKFDHTWTEGVRVCRSFAVSFSFQSSLQAVLRHAVNVSHITQSPNRTRHQSSSYYGDIGVSDAGSPKGADCCKLIHVFVCACVLFFSIAGERK